MNMDWGVIGGIAGVAGATASGYAIWQNKKDKQPVIIVENGFGFISIGSYVGTTLMITAVKNTGHVPVIINGLRYILRGSLNKKYGELIAPNPDGEHRLPYKLAPGESLSLWRSVSEFAQSLQARGINGNIGLQVQINDRIGNKYLSKSQPFDIDGCAAHRD